MGKFITHFKAYLRNFKSKSRRPIIVIISFLIIATGFLLYTNNAKAVDWWKGGGGAWGARKQLTVTNNSSATLSANTTVVITIDTKSLVNSGKLRRDCSDLRILYQPSSSTTTELTRHLTFAPTETGQGTCITSSATKVYFNLQSSLSSSGSTTDYYLYYKNPSASTPTSTDNAFDISSINATLVCPFDGTTTCAAGETPSTETGAIRYSGGKSALIFDHVNDYVEYSLASGVGTALTSKVFTIETWIYVNNITEPFGILGDTVGSNDAFKLQSLSGTDISFRGEGSSTGIVLDCANAFTSTGWYHVAVVSTGPSAYLYKNGTQCSSDSIVGETYSQGTVHRISWGGYFGVRYMAGIIDEYRFSNTIRYTSNFTPSTAPFVRDANTMVLFHFDENGTDPRQSGKAIDDSGNNVHGTISGAQYVDGLVGVDASSVDIGKVSGQSFGSHEGVFVEEGTTNKITNPSFENATYDTNWTTGANLTATSNATAPYYKFGVKSAKLVASASAISGTSNMFTTNINVGSSATHGFSAFVYDATSGNVGGTVSSSIAKIVFQGVAQTTTYTDVGGGWWRLSYAASAAGAQEFGIEPQVSKTIYVDAAQLEAKATQLAGYSTSYADGSLGSGYAWTGTANNSTSTRTAGDLRYATSGNISVSAGTFSAWVWYPSYYSSCSGAHQGILYTNGANPLFMGQNCGTAWFSVNGTNGGAASGTMPTYGANKWHHYVGTWNGSALTFYIDGTAQTPGSYTATPTATSIILNTDIGGNTGIDTVTLSDLRIYDTALTSTQVTDLYQSGLVGHSQGLQVDAFGDTSGEDPVSIYHMDEAQGTSVNDSTVQANHFTLGTGSSAPSWETTNNVSGAANPRGTNLKFDGSNDYIYRNDDSDFNPGTGSFSVSGYFRHPSTISGTDTLITRYSSAGYKVYMNSSGYLCFGIDDDSTWGPDDSACSTSSQGSFADSKWHTFTAVKTSTTSIALYIDGILVGSDSSLAATATLNAGSSSIMYMGIDADFASNPWAGNLDEVYFYPYARSAAQIKANTGGATLGASTDPLDKGLVGYWKMDESSGTTTSDSSGNLYTGTLGVGASAPTWTNGKFGGGLSFDGTSDLVNLSTITKPTTSFPITLSFWVNPTTTSPVGIFDSAPGQGNVLRNYSAGNIEWWNGQPQVSLGLSSSVWQHVTVVYDHDGTNRILRYYKNGTLTSSSSFAGTNEYNWSNFTLGNINGGDAGWFSGSLDEFRVYNRALSPAEVQQLYNYAPGPVGHWKMDEGNGLSAFDSSGNGNTGTLTNGPVWTNAKLAGGVQFDGSNDSVLVTDANSLDTPAGITTSAWVNFSTLASGGDYGFMSKWTSGSGWFIEPNYSGTSWRIYFVFSDATANSWVFDPGISTTNRWYHVSITYDKTSMKFYTDGVLVGSTALTKDLITNSQPLYLGYSNGSGGGAHYLTGKMDDVRIYNYARSSAQVIQDMNAGHPLGGSPVGSQVAHWKLDEGYGTTANDSSINGNSLTLSSATAAWTNAGKFGKAWNGDGALYMSRADDADFDFTAVEDFAISGWVKSDSASNPGATEYVVNKANATTAGYAVYFNTSGNLCFGIDDDTTWGPDIASCSTTDLYDATWHHFSAMRDYSGTLKTFIYVDGISRDNDTDSTSATFANSLSLYVGDRDGTNNGDEFTGDIDEVKIYRGALTPAEIKIDYNRGQSLVLGSVSNNSTYAPNAANQEYCVPGDSTSCAAPVGEWRLDERTGSTVNDTSGNGYSGTLTLGPSWTKGKIGAALNFDGSDDYVDFGTAAGLDLTSSMTFSAWINSSSFASQQRVFQRRGAGGYGFTILNSTTIRFTQFGVVDKDITVSALSANTWYHVTWVFNDTADTVTVYLNGQSVGSTALASAIVSVPASSNIMGGTGNMFSGKIDHATLYNYARTASQVAWDYNRGAPIAHYRLDECAGTVANDASGNGYTGTITIGASGTNTSAGNCTSGTSSEAWYNGVAGKFNSSLKFDGTDDYVSVTDNSNLENAVMSLSAWIYTSAGFPSQTGPLGKRITSSEYIQYSFSVSSNTFYWLQSEAGSSWNTLVSTPSNTISAGWHHYVGTNNGTTARLYIDGKEVGTADSSPATTLAASTDPFIIGEQRVGSSDSYFTGQIDDVRIYNYALTTTQIKNIMNGDFAVRYAPATGQP